VIVVLLLVLPVGRSRAAWLAAIAGCIYILWPYKKSLLKTQRISAFTQGISVLHKRILIAAIGLLITFAGFGLYKYKQGSADGRLLMWQVSFEMIKDKPLLGFGQGGFEANYANYQAEWFRSGKGTETQKMVAGMPDAPFNELIRVWVNYGAIGLILIFALLIVLFHKVPQRNTKIYYVSLRILCGPLRFSALLKGGLISIIIFSLFSYPVDVTPILIQLILLVALLANQFSITNYRLLSTDNHRLLITKLTASILFITIIPFAILDLKDKHTGLTHWQEANELYQYELYGDASAEFDHALKYLPKRCLLLQMKAKCYTMFDKWDEAISTAITTRNYTNGQILNIVLGDSYKATGRYKESEQAYKQASAMVPHKFFPKYLLVLMYDKSGQINKALCLAHELLNKEIKIESTAIQEMREELTKIINTREKEQEAKLSKNVALPVQPPFLNEERR
jgi:hypothetical protein